MISFTEERASKMLVGQGVEVSVDEPWRFEGPDGTNVLKDA